MLTFAYEIMNRFQCPEAGPADINAADESVVRLFCQDIIQTRLSYTGTAVGTLERIGHATFGGAKKSVQKSEFIVFCETQQWFAVFIELVSVVCAQQFTVCFSTALTSLPCPGVRVC